MNLNLFPIWALVVSTLFFVSEPVFGEGETDSSEALKEEATEKTQKQVLLNFSGTELRHVLQTIHKHTNERFLFDENLIQGKRVTFFSGRPIAVSSLMSTLTSILEIQGLALVRSSYGEDGLYKIVSAEEASRQTTPTYKNSTIGNIPDSDEIVTLLFQVKNLTPADLVAPLQKMASIPNAISAIEGSSIIKITDSAFNVKRMVELLEAMDEMHYSIDEKRVKVKHVQASTLVAELKPMIDVENQRLATQMQNRLQQAAIRRRDTSASKVSLKSMRPIVVTAIDRLSTIYINGTKEQVAALEKTIIQLDSPESLRNKLHLFPTKHRQPSELVGALNVAFKSPSPKRRSKRGPQPKVEVVFHADNSQGKVLALCAESVVSEIKNLIAQLDQPGLEGITKTYVLQHHKVQTIEGRIKALFPRKRGQPSISIVRDDTNNALIVRGSELQHEEMKRAIGSIDIEGEDPRSFKEYSLEFTNADEVAGIIRNILGHSHSRHRRASPSIHDELITVDRNSNALMVLAKEPGHKKISDLIASIDKESKEKKITQYYKLLHAKPEDVAKNLRELYPRPRGRRGSPVDEGMEITLDIPTRTLIIKAEISRHSRIKETVVKLDVDGKDSRFMKTYPLRYTDPNEASRVLKELMANTIKRGRGATTQNDIISVDRVTSAIIVYAQQETHNRVLEAMAGIDVPNSERYQTVFYTIENADPRVLFYNLREFFANRNRYSRTQDFYLSLNEKARTLMVKALPEKQKEVEEAIKKLDVGGVDPREIKIYELEYASPRDATRVLQSVLNLSTNRGGRSRSRSPYPDLISADEANSSIVLFSSSETHATVAKTLEEIDVVTSADKQIVYYQTEHLPILEAVRLMQEIFNFQVGATRGRNTGEKLILDENSNSMVINASPRTHSKVKDVLKELDVPGLGENELRFYSVENTTALEAAKMVEQLYGLPMKAPRRNGPNQTGSRALPLQRNPMVLPNAESNTLIVNAPTKTHESIQKMLLEMKDIGKMDKMTVEFYTLENTNAEDVAPKVAELFNLHLGNASSDILKKGKQVSSRVKSSGTSDLRPIRPGEKGEGETDDAVSQEPDLSGVLSERNAFFFDGQPTVIPEKNLNSIILVAPGYLHIEVKKTIATLDKRRPQVLIEVAIVESKGEDLSSLGVEFGYLGKSAGVSTPFGLRDLNQNLTGNFPLQAAGATSLEGLVFGVLRDDGSMPVILNAIGEKENIEIKSTPVLLVNDNEEANFNSLQQEPTVKTTTNSNSTNIAFENYADAGTGFTITPHISQGNFIRLELNVKVESFSGQPLAAGIPPAKTSSTLQTSVTVPDRHMAIIGGMEAETLTNRDKRVPLLGDIPLLGNLFKSQTKVKEKTKLYLFISPRILRDEEFEDLKEVSSAISLGPALRTKKTTAANAQVETAVEVISETP
jgi:type II secretion system protein D